MSNNTLDSKVRRQVADELGHYVYALIDPRTSIPFYVGKGRGERFASHGYEAYYYSEQDDNNNTGAKVTKINEIRKAGLEPEIWIIRHGMKSDTEYTAVEAACIDLFQTFPVLPTTEDANRFPNQHIEQLTNARKEASRGHGIMRLSDLVEEMTAPVLDTTRPLLTITLGGWTDTPEGEDMPGGVKRYGYGYKHEWLPSEERKKHYYDIALSASGWWKINPSEEQKRNIEYAVAIHRGVTRALLRIIPGSWVYNETFKRSAFKFEVVEDGEVFEETVGEFGHREPPRKKGTQSLYYWPRRS
ncbi:MAG: GIY-YIG nuclease family protein [Alloscardovia omnicolens]|uniref:GIY-YIG nuclease family protein n=1 Tax=Alloscardovia omnicolens TaxID=419015 RepID=UPI0024312FE5|nr:GIY-YIG nuclease family protein [Alloscardovia omnicolens]MBS6346140.1 GIY-YIG nuclease family protein [Alloscardovia omnicolens]